MSGDKRYILISWLHELVVLDGYLMQGLGLWGLPEKEREAPWEWRAQHKR